MSRTTLKAMWACPHCNSVVATEDKTHPPGSPKSEVSSMGCAACKTRKIDPEEWVRVSL